MSDVQAAEDQMRMAVRVMATTLAAFKTELVALNFNERDAQKMVTIWMEATVTRVPDTV